jgi:hypothetical protein
MGEHVRITPDGRLTIDAAAWIAHRTDGVHRDLTADLHSWAREHAHHIGPDQTQAATGAPPPNWPALAHAWCDARSHQIDEPGMIRHVGTRLDTDLWLLPAATADGRRIAVLGTSHDSPTVHANTCADSWQWRDADSVVIACPIGHTWRWKSGREVLTAAGRPATLTTVFGVNLDAPFSPCPTCTQFHLGARATPCGCDRSPWIVCPVCGQRCDVHLPTP